MTFLCGNIRHGAFQGHAQDFSQETEAGTGSGYGWDTSIPQPPPRANGFVGPRRGFRGI